MERKRKKKAECLDDTSLDKMEEEVSDINDKKNEKIYKEKDSEFIDDTFPDDMEECVYERNNNKNEKYDEEKMKVKQQILRAPQWMKVKE